MSEQILHDRIRLTIADEVARIALIRGSGNALDAAAGLAFAEATELVSAAASTWDTGAGSTGAGVRVALITAAGSAFCVGGDLRDFAQAPEPGAHVAGVAANLHRAILTLRAASIPVVSAIHGTVAGGGIGIALAADVVLMASEATLRSAYTAAGLTPDCGATWFLSTRIGEARTMDLVLTNRVITGGQAAEWGLVSRAVPAAELDAAVEATIDGLRRGSRPALAHSKRLVTATSQAELEARLGNEARTVAAAIDSPDGREGIAAFLGKRAPRFA